MIAIIYLTLPHPLPSCLMNLAIWISMFCPVIISTYILYPIFQCFVVCMAWFLKTSRITFTSFKAYSKNWYYFYDYSFYVCNTMLYMIFQYGWEPVLIQQIFRFRSLIEKLLKSNITWRIKYVFWIHSISLNYRGTTLIITSDTMHIELLYNNT